ncbi:hypothetical protein IL54_0440 [Sphingobium sp. ba1]|nr:hypothetical protein IL54_0440 [Sphingobium sp. ba1]
MERRQIKDDMIAWHHQQNIIRSRL